MREKKPTLIFGSSKSLRCLSILPRVTLTKAPTVLLLFLCVCPLQASWTRPDQYEVGRLKKKKKVVAIVARAPDLTRLEHRPPHSQMFPPNPLQACVLIDDH